MAIKKIKTAPQGALSFPHAAPEPGAAREIVPGVLWARLPLSGQGGCVNVYLLREEDGWTLVDAGPGDEATETLLASTLERALAGAPLTRVICTHMHPDQIGLAGWVCRRFGAELWMSRLEYLTARVLTADRPPPPREAVDFYLAAGWSEDHLADLYARYGAYGQEVRALPQAYARIEDRDDLAVGGRVWRVLTGAGHSPEHVCLWQPELRLLVSGDQVLPATPAAVGVWPIEPSADPLADWLASCWRIMAAIPDDVLVLPSRDAPFHGLHARLDEIIAHAESRLDLLKISLDRPRRVVDLIEPLYGRKLPEAERGRATGEVIAQLNYLRRRGRVRYAIDQAGVAWFELDPEAGESEDDLETL